MRTLPDFNNSNHPWHLPPLADNVTPTRMDSFRGPQVHLTEQAISRNNKERNLPTPGGSEPERDVFAPMSSPSMSYNWLLKMVCTQTTIIDPTIITALLDSRNRDNYAHASEAPGDLMRKPNGLSYEV